MYEYAVTEAESLSIDEEKLKKFTDIVTLGAEYVSINFVWESAGYFWLANDLESMVDSFPVNSSAHVDYVTAVVNSNSSIGASGFSMRHSSKLEFKMVSRYSLTACG